VKKMKSTGPYDNALQMFVHEPREPDIRLLRFLRWLAEEGKLEHAIAGPSAGRYAVPEHGVAKSAYSTAA
jgi:hypothetical protein